MTEQPHIPPDPAAKLHDRRGALALDAGICALLAGAVVVIKVVRTGRKFTDKSVLRGTWMARRTLADLVTRTETLRPSSYS